MARRTGLGYHVLVTQADGSAYAGTYYNTDDPKGGYIIVNDIGQEAFFTDDANQKIQAVA